MVSVRMGEMAITTDPEQELVARGLGSCIGLAMVDRQAAVTGLAHIVLPERVENPHVATHSSATPAAKYADHAIPELVRRMCDAGARRNRIEVAIAGGASMFATARPLDIGVRNQDAVREALAEAQLRVDAAAVGGDRGRTLRVCLHRAGVTSASAGETPTQLLPGGRPPRRRRDPQRSPA